MKVDEQEKPKIIIKLNARSISEPAFQTVAAGYAANGDHERNVIKAEEVEIEVFLLRNMGIPGCPYQF